MQNNYAENYASSKLLDEGNDLASRIYAEGSTFFKGFFFNHLIAVLGRFLCIPRAFDE